MNRSGAVVPSAVQSAVDGASVGDVDLNSAWPRLCKAHTSHENASSLPAAIFSIVALVKYARSDFPHNTYFDTILLIQIAY